MDISWQSFPENLEIVACPKSKPFNRRNRMKVKSNKNSRQEISENFYIPHKVVHFSRNSMKSCPTCHRKFPEIQTGFFLPDRNKSTLRNLISCVTIENPCMFLDKQVFWKI